MTMSLPIFPFRFSARPRFHEDPLHQTRITGQNSGTERRAAEFGDDFKLRVTGSIRLPQTSTSKNLNDWLDFVEDARGAYGLFLYKCVTDRYHLVVDDEIGPGTGTQTVFYLAHKYIDDTTISVEVNGSPMTLGADYTFGGNETAPAITFIGAPGLGQTVTVSYEFYVPFRFETEGYAVDLLASKPTDATRNVLIAEVSLVTPAQGAQLA